MNGYIYLGEDNTSVNSVYLYAWQGGYPGWLSVKMSFHTHHTGKVYLCCGSSSGLPASCDAQTASHNPLLTGRMPLSVYSITKLT